MHTFSRGVSLHELIPGAGIFELRRQEGELGELLVDEADFRCEVIGMDVEG